MQKTAPKNCDAVSPDVIGSPFHNPYTFIPFSDEGIEVSEPTALTYDETDESTYTGIIKLELETLSPLMSLLPTDNKEQTYFPALTIGNDVIVPATSLRGTLRTLLSIITGGPLSSLDQTLYLCQGRDCSPKNGKDVELGRVVVAGNSLKDGKILLGRTQLVESSKLENLILRSHIRLERPCNDLWIDNPSAPQEISRNPSDKCRWQLKLSGKKVGNEKSKPRKKNGECACEHDGAFLPGTTEITVPACFWGQFEGRNRNSVKTGLENGDLVWLFPKEGIKSVQSADDLDSLQWARWGRQGTKMAKLLPEDLRPNSLHNDGMVDIVGNLFGEVFMRSDEEGKIPLAFAARIRPENIVFYDAVQKLQKQVKLAPLSNPHPGCLAFYRLGEPDKLNNASSPLRGYKVYRTTQERGVNAPWLYDNQPIYAGVKKQEFGKSKLCREVDLLPEGCKGSCNISFRSLSKAELALILLALSCDLRIGGGKPLGLGHCRVARISIVTETERLLENFIIPSNRPCIPEEFRSDLENEHYMEMAELYCKTQIPVEKLRYPSFTDSKNGKTANRGGQHWFAAFAAPNKSGGQTGGNIKPGLQAVRIAGDLQAKCQNKQAMKAQTLPKFSANAPLADRLFGYGLTGIYKDSTGTTIFTGFKDSPQSDCDASYREANHSPNRETRRQAKEERWK